MGNLNSVWPNHNEADGRADEIYRAENGGGHCAGQKQCARLFEGTRRNYVWISDAWGGVCSQPAPRTPPMNKKTHLIAYLYRGNKGRPRTTDYLFKPAKKTAKIKK